MPIIYACVCPHMAGGSERFADAAQAASEELASFRPEVLLVVNVCGAWVRRTIGVLTAGEAVLGREARAINVALAERIVQEARTASLPVEPLRRWEGTLNLACAPPERARLVAIAVSALEPRFHFEFGRALGRALDDSGERAAIICAVDLSRSPHEAAGRIFDEHYRRAIEAWDVKWLVGVEADVRRRARESAVAQTAVLMGALSTYRIQPRLLAFEASEHGRRLVAAIDILGERGKRTVATKELHHA